MSGDKRTVATDALETLGMIIDETQKRDAIHLAVEPVAAGEQLWPSQKVKLINGVAFKDNKGGVGIVDPFLGEPVQVGQRFWLVLLPRTIKSLRHVWSHPAFPDEPEVTSQSIKIDDDKLESVAFIKHWADKAGLSYDGMMWGAADYQETGDYMVQGGRWEGFGIPEEFWDHWEKVTGKKATNRWSFFSCSC